jgi:hypothetical protein
VCGQLLRISDLDLPSHFTNRDKRLRFGKSINSRLDSGNEMVSCKIRLLDSDEMILIPLTPCTLSVICEGCPFPLNHLRK